MSNETVRGFLARRKRELENQLTAARGHVAEIEAELAEIEQAEKALPPLRTVIADASIPATVQLTATSLITGAAKAGPATLQTGKYELKGQDAKLVHSRLERFSQMTIKQLVMQALRDRHPASVTAADLRDFMRDAYGRVIEPSSLRPQLSRLKADQWIKQDASNDEWSLTPAGILYDHPTSMNAKDEPSEEEMANMFRTLTGAVQPSPLQKLGEALNPKPKK